MTGKNAGRSVVGTNEISGVRNGKAQRFKLSGGRLAGVDA